jgi:hypothetical protein
MQYESRGNISKHQMIVIEEPVLPIYPKTQICEKRPSFYHFL